MVVIRQRRPSALSCVYSVSAHDIRAGETNLSPMRRPWPWYHISWSETHQAADTPPFLPGRKKMKPSLTDTSRQNYKLTLAFYRNVFHLSSAFFSLSVSLWDADVKKKESWTQCMIAKAFLSLILLPLHHETIWTFHSLCRDIDWTRQADLFHGHMASQASSFKLSVCAVGWPMAADRVNNKYVVL